MSSEHLGYNNDQLIAAQVTLSVKYLTFSKQAEQPILLILKAALFQQSKED